MTLCFGFPPVADMTRSKLNVVQCTDEYMNEEHIEHENTTHKDVESSHLNCNDEEGLTDSDDEGDDETVATDQGNC